MLFSCGCYTTGAVSKEDLKARAEPVDIIVFTKDSVEYRFSGENYRIQGDTVSGYGLRIQNASTQVLFNAAVAFADIDSIETNEFDVSKTAILCGGIGAVGTSIVLLLTRHNSPTYILVQPGPLPSQPTEY